MTDSPTSSVPPRLATSNRRTFLVGAATATALTFLPAALRAAPAAAGTPANYPEYPYPTTLLGAYDENYRGQFHFSSRTGWMNDINAPLYYKGVYHMFYQHNPHGLTWDTMHWGHATSRDLVHWTQQPIALEPGVQPGNLWSGAGVVDKHNVTGLKTGPDAPIVVFTGTGGVLMDYSTDGAKTFKSYGNGRVVAVPPASSTDSRDPKVLWDAARNQWVMVFWSNEGGNGYDIYTSTNLLDWKYASRFAADWLFECPDMYPMRVDGGSTVKWVINAASTKYVVGDFDGTRFTTSWTEPIQMDVGRNIYAGQVFNDMPDGRIVQMAWQQGNFGSVWTGNATFPAELKLVTLPEGLRVTRAPVAEISTLRRHSRTWANQLITTDPGSNPMAGIRTDTYEVIAEFDTSSASASRFGLKLHAYADGTCNSNVSYDLTRQTLMGTALAPVGGRVKIHALVDRGQLEVFGNDGLFSSSNNLDFDPALDSRGIAIYAKGGQVRLVSLQYHELQRAWPAFVAIDNPGSNLAGPWQAAGGAWEDIADGNKATASGDGFYLSAQSGTDFTYEADLSLGNAVAAGLTFRANATATQHYTANINTSGGGQIKLWRPGADLATHSTPITAGKTYHLKVVAEGFRIRVFLGDDPHPVIDVADSAYGSGLLGLNVFSGAATAQNADAALGSAPGFSTNLAAPWHTVSGAWIATSDGQQGLSTGDGFYLSAQSGTDFTYEADLSLGNAVAAGLTFRANATATQHYTANINTSGG
ncbi:MAG TPA: glycoside hydrolase family 32 protein, partial [Streptosporangiaceae bacterium]|nr:glycoside hydrolase family 32 protein [Streptosporangiaceae bacterium]